jgi:excisionase family DNA binding protein
MSAPPSPSPEAALASAFRQLVQTEVAAQVAAALDRRLAAGELLSTAEAAAHARVTPETIRRWVTAGKLTEHRAGREVRVARADLDALLHRGTRAPRNAEKTPEQLAAERFRVG